MGILKLGHKVIADDNGRLVKGIVTFIKHCEDPNPEDRDYIDSISMILWYWGRDRSPHNNEDKLIQLDNDFNKWYTGNNIYPDWESEDNISSMRRRFNKSFIIYDCGSQIEIFSTITNHDDITEEIVEYMGRYVVKVYEKGEKGQIIEENNDLDYLLIKYNHPDIADLINKKKLIKTKQ